MYIAALLCVKLVHWIFRILIIGLAFCILAFLGLDLSEAVSTGLVLFFSKLVFVIYIFGVIEQFDLRLVSYYAYNRYTFWEIVKKESERLLK